MNRSERLALVDHDDPAVPVVAAPPMQPVATKGSLVPCRNANRTGLEVATP